MAHRRGPPANESTPICRCRVLYLGSSVPHITKDGLQGIQEPLRELYPSEGISGAKGIDSWLSVWSNGLLLENVDEKQKKFTRFFPIEVLHYCAAVRYVLVPASASGGSEKERVARFLPLDSPFARSPSIAHPPLFAAILRRTTGIKVLECHVFICKRETPANALVRCCFHAYADSMQARQLDGGLYGSIYGPLPNGARAGHPPADQSVAEAQIDVIEKVEEWQADQSVPSTSNGDVGQGDELSVYNGDKNHKVWAGPARSERELVYNEYELAGRGASVYGSTGSRAARPRQMVMPAAPPPPPPTPPPETEAKKKARKQKTRAERSSAVSPSRANMENGRSPGSGHGMNGHGPITNGHGPVLNGHGHPMNGHGHPMNGHGHPMNGHRTPQRVASRQERQPSRPNGAAVSPRQRVARPRPPPAHMYAPVQHMAPPQLVYGTLQPAPLPAMVPGPYGPAVMTLPYRPRRSASRAAEEPVYLPSARPLSPTASYQPGHFPHEAYLMQQQYATVDRRRKARKKTRKEDGSPPNTGIYKRRNHLNEKAFGFSIQQEHRSRSYGSLANADGADGRPQSREELRKSREMQQMLHELDLSADELERSEVRPGLYRGPGSVSQLSHHSQHSGFRRL